MSLTAKTSPSGKLLVPGITVLLIVALLVQFLFRSKTNTAEAQIAVLYASSCLGGWKNPDLITGAPEVADNPDIEYTEQNSAILKNTQTQLFCGGFSGTIPENVDRTNITVHFSWEAKIDSDTSPASKNDEDVSSVIQIVEPGEASSTDEVIATSSSTEEIETPDEPTEEETIIEEVAAPAEEEAVSWWNRFSSVAYAEETAVIEIVDENSEVISVTGNDTGVVEQSNETDIPEEKIATTSTISASSTTESNATSTNETASTTEEVKETVRRIDGVNNTDRDNALFEVLFTTNNEEWHVLGYVPRINNDIQFELPLDMFTSVEDFSRLQISLKTMERFDDMPNIYLDSMWVEVAYVDAGQDPLSPPGSVAGDIVVNKISTEEASLVTVFRNTSLEMISNILSSQASSTTSSTSTITASSTEAVSVATTSLYANASSTIILYEANVPEETKHKLRATPGVVVELWLHNRLTDSWTRVADNSIIATEPYATMFDKKVFWFDPNMASLWMFDALSGGYASQSFTAGELVAIEFTHSSNESYIIKFDEVSGTLVPVKKETVSSGE